MPAAERVLELFSDLLGRGKADATILADLRREHVPEGPYHEYKRGKWFEEHGARGIRRCVSGFANAEGGVLILGIVGGEDSQGPDKWKFESPKSPSEGWDVWLGKALSDVAIKTRVAWQVVPVEGHDLVVIAANRAQELIRVYEKPNLVCHLRVGEHTHPIPETLFADLALGRRAKPDLAIEQLKVSGVSDSFGFRIALSLLVHNQGLLWVSGVSVAWCGYAARGERASASLMRELALLPTTRGDLAPIVGSFNVTGRNELSAEVRPFQQTKFVGEVKALPVTQASGRWAWYGGILVLPKDGSPLWAQAAVHGENWVLDLARAWPLARGTLPVVAWYPEAEVPPNLETTFGARVPE